MVTCARNMMIVSVVICGLAFGNGVHNNSGEEDRHKWEPNGKYEGEITVTARVIKDVYEPNEPVPVVIGIANHSSKPVYLLTDTPSVLGEGGAGVADANGVRVPGRAPLPHAPVLPPSYFMKKDGRSIFVEPVSRIEGPGLLLSLVPDALCRHHGSLAPGTYYLDLGSIEIVHEIDDIIVRKDVSHRLWKGPEAKTVFSLYELNPVKIAIQRPEAKTVIPKP